MRFRPLARVVVVVKRTTGSVGSAMKWMFVMCGSPSAPMVPRMPRVDMRTICQRAARLSVRSGVGAGKVVMLNNCIPQFSTYDTPAVYTEHLPGDEARIVAHQVGARSRDVLWLADSSQGHAVGQGVDA